jgi:WD40 repeat protein
LIAAAVAVAGTLLGGALLAGTARRDPPPASTQPSRIVAGRDNGPILLLGPGTRSAIDPVTGARVTGDLVLPEVSMSATWSPDGALLAFAGTGTVSTLDVQTGVERLLAALPGCSGEQLTCDLAWSADGRFVAVGVGHRLDVIEVATGQVTTRWTFAEGPGSARVASPAWSPDGATIAFAASRALMTIGFPAGEPRVLVEGNFDAFGPRDIAWSPDGGRLAFLSGTSDPAGGWRLRIDTVGQDGSGRRVLGDAGRCHCVGWGPPGFGWSPDGRLMAIVTLGFGGVPEPPGDDPAPGVDGLIVMQADGTVPRLVATGVAGRPLWQPRP